MADFRARLQARRLTLRAIHRDWKAMPLGPERDQRWTLFVQFVREYKQWRQDWLRRN